MASNIRPAGIFDTSYEDDMSLERTRFDKIRAYALFAALLLIPLLTRQGPLGLDILPPYIIATVNTIAIFVIAAQGLNILVGYTGQISLGHAAFMAVGAYSGSLLARGFDFTIGESLIVIPSIPFWFAVPIAAVITGIVGLIFGLPSLRVKGFYLAMATLAAQFIIPWVLEHPLGGLTNAPRPLQDIPAPELFGLNFSSAGAMYYIIIPVAVFMMLAARNIIRTRTGRAFISIRDNDLAAELLGINIFNYKLQAFFLSAVYAGVAGALIAFDQNTLSIESFKLNTSIELLSMLVIGGAGFPLAAVFGVSFVKLLTLVLIPTVGGPLFNSFLPTLLPFIEPVNIGAAISPILTGLVLIAFLILEPRGLAYRWEILKIAWKIRPYSY
ncbi:MAG: branched-chain amino acid ABC transporter permease [Aggregatilineales bacterium]